MLSDAAECAVRESVSLVATEMGVPWAYRVVWLVEGVKLAADTAATLAAVEAVQAGYLKTGLDLTFEDDGGNVLKRLSHGNSHTGVRVTTIPGWPAGGGAELAGFATYAVQAEATYLLTTSQPVYQSWTETVTFAGGGPQRGVFATTNGAPVAQLLRKKTPYFCTQAGTVVGLRAHPPVPAPLFPTSLLLEDPQISRTSPRRDGTALQDYALSYQYRFGSTTSLTGNPKPPPL